MLNQCLLFLLGTVKCHKCSGVKETSCDKGQDKGVDTCSGDHCIRWSDNSKVVRGCAPQGINYDCFLKLTGKDGCINLTPDNNKAISQCSIGSVNWKDNGIFDASGGKLCVCTGHHCNSGSFVMKGTFYTYVYFCKTLNLVKSQF